MVMGQLRALELLLLHAIAPTVSEYVCEINSHDRERDLRNCKQMRDHYPEAMASPVLQTEKGKIEACAPSHEQANLLQSKIGCTPFYLNEEGPLSMAEVQACYENYLDLMSNDRRTDDKTNPERAQHLGGLHILQQLRSHPSRVFDPDAAPVHFTGLTPSLSHFVDTFNAESGCNRVKGYEERHYDRMQAAAAWLKEEFRRLPQTKERVYVIVSSYYTTMQSLGDVYHLMASSEGRRRLLFGNSDLSFTRPWNDVADGNREKDLTPNHITVPYVASYLLDDASRKPEITCDASRREVSFFFAGHAGRTGEGAKRAALMRTMELADTNKSLIIDHRSDYFASGPAGSTWAKGAQQYADRLLRTRYCLVPGARPTPSHQRGHCAIAPSLRDGASS